MSDRPVHPLECALAAGADVFGGTEDASPRRRLTRMAELFPQCVPECCGATATLTTDDERTSAASHPDLAELAAVQLRTGEGPIPQAMRTNEPAHVTDVLCVDDWPTYRAVALDTGVRSSATLPFRRSGMTVTVTVYRFQPGKMRQATETPLALLGELLTSLVVHDRRYEKALVAVDQMDAAMRSRPIVDQACGILMHATGCDAEEAFATLRRISQQANEKLVDVAKNVVETRGRVLRPSPASGSGRVAR